MFYGYKKSDSTSAKNYGNDYKIMGYSGIGLSIALLIIAIIHHQVMNGDDLPLYYFSLIFSKIKE